MVAALALSAALLWPSPPTAAGPSSAASTAEHATGFDHAAHRKVERDGDGLACDDCHVPDRRGRLARLDHATCFARCHGGAPPPRSPRDRQRRVPYPVAETGRAPCRACHAPAAMERVVAGSAERLGVAPPPAARPGDFRVTASHAAHASVPRGCRTCHAAAGTAMTSPRDHAACAACHASGALTMARCDRCHAAAGEPTLLAGPHAPVAARFDHRKHLARGATCAGCHEGVNTASGAVARPSKTACSGCHDGKTAFSMLAAVCRRCHAPPARPPPIAALAAVRFSHARHAGKVDDCARCHASAGRESRLGHAACTGLACHDGEFSIATPTVCGACHVAVEPWIAQHRDPPPRGATEFGARFSHRDHLGGDRPRLVAPCTACHAGSQDAVAATTADHQSCQGAGCHAIGDGPGAAPRLDTCSACHVAGLLERHAGARAQRRFAVRGRFRHGSHRTSAGGADVACSACHDVAASTGLGDLRPPEKARCAPCHDGRTAFKLTGHTCARCHQTAAELAPPSGRGRAQNGHSDQIE